MTGCGYGEAGGAPAASPGFCWFRLPCGRFMSNSRMRHCGARMTGASASPGRALPGGRFDSRKYAFAPRSTRISVTWPRTRFSVMVFGPSFCCRIVIGGASLTPDRSGMADVLRSASCAFAVIRLASAIPSRAIDERKRRMASLSEMGKGSGMQPIRESGWPTAKMLHRRNCSKQPFVPCLLDATIAPEFVSMSAGGAACLRCRGTLP